MAGLKDFDLDKLDDEQIANLLENYRKAGKTEEPKYTEILALYDRRRGKGLSFESSFAAIRDAAFRGQFLSYKQLAEASGLQWSFAVRYAMPSHLQNLLEYSYRNGLPLLSAIVVNQKNVDTGDMEPETLRGFITGARDLGITVTDEGQFLKDQQQEVFRRAREGTLNA